jgi:hypothetical protein
VKYTAKVTDVFGNAVAGVTPALSIINLNSTLPTSTNADGISEFTVTYPSTPGKSALALSISALDVPGLPVAVKQISSFIDVVDANAALIAEKAARAADKVAADAALAAEKAGRAAEKAAADKSIFDLSGRVAALTKQVAQIKALYNKLAIRFKQKTIK